MLCALLLASLLSPQGRVGPVGEGQTLLPTNRLIQPAGVWLEMEGRPVDVHADREGVHVFVKDRSALRVLDAKGMRELQRVESPGGASLTGLAVSKWGNRVWFTSAKDQLHEFGAGRDGVFKLLRSITLPGVKGSEDTSFPCGIALADNEQIAYVCLSRNNTVAEVDLAAGRVVREIPVGIAPYDIERVGSTAWVSNQGGRRAAAGQKSAPSASTETPVDERGVAKTGTVSMVDLEAGKELAQIEVGLQPSDVLALPQHNLVLVANANSDTVSWIDTTRRRELLRLETKPDAKLPFGSMPNALALGPDGRTVYAALAGNNALAAIDIGNPRRPAVRGFIPTGWYPAAIATVGGQLFVANVKGVGSRSRMREVEKGWNSHDHRGTVQKIPIPDRATLATYTERVRSHGKVLPILASYERTTDTGVAPVPVPARLGEPSVFKHVIYVIKENRTYDQLFGDMDKGTGMAALCTFKEENAPNHRALANEFVLLDNYYCNGVLSADGHSWATEGNVTPYLERAFGGFSRSYTFGDDPITYSSTGFLWDHVLAGGLSFRNYGEMDYAEPPKGMSGKQVWDEYKAGKRTEFSQNIGVERLRRYSSRDYPGWNMNIPDQLRMDRFLQEFRQFEIDGTLPNLTIVYLPQDHLGGAVSARSHMADNDLAVGRLVEAVSKSRFWKDTVIFINEDDPQNGYDHVDGHRSICLVASPYTKRGAVSSEFFNQTAVLHTILQIFGLPPMNQQDASAPLMSACFTNTPDFTPYTARPNQVPLDEFKDPAAMSAQALHWERILAKIPLHRTGMKTEEDMDNLNRMMWHEMRGYDTPYPADWAGAHGKGLKPRGLKVGG